MSLNHTMETNDDIVIHPVRLPQEQDIPKTGLLLVNPAEARGAERRRLYNSNLSVHQRLGYFIAGPAIGAPLAVLTMEKLIALGAKRIILFGWCGSMSHSLGIGDLLVPTSALSGEGTSAYYVTGGKPPSPSISLIEAIRGLLRANTLDWSEGCVWSTDAPYREKRSQLKKLREEDGACAVDMEHSALCSAAGFRGIDFAALLVVSDEVWGSRWSPGFSRQEFKSQSRTLIDLLLQTLPLE